MEHQALAVLKMMIPALGLGDEPARARPFKILWGEFTKLFLGFERVRNGMKVGRGRVHSRARESSTGQIDLDPRYERSSHKKEENIVFEGRGIWSRGHETRIQTASLPPSQWPKSTTT